jgi:hypothetical protein
MRIAPRKPCKIHTLNTFLVDPICSNCAANYLTWAGADNLIAGQAYENSYKHQSKHKHRSFSFIVTFLFDTGGVIPYKLGERGTQIFAILF